MTALLWRHNNFVSLRFRKYIKWNIAKYKMIDVYLLNICVFNLEQIGVNVTF